MDDQAEGPGRLADDAVAGILNAVGIASFRWTAATDHLEWSPNATAILGLKSGVLPRTSRNYARLLTRGTLHQRSRAVPALGGAATSTAWSTSYRVAYAIRADVRDLGAEVGVEEIGRVLLAPRRQPDRHGGRRAAHGRDRRRRAGRQRP